MHTITSSLRSVACTPHHEPAAVATHARHRKPQHNKPARQQPHIHRVSLTVAHQHTAHRLSVAAAAGGSSSSSTAGDTLAGLRSWVAAAGGYVDPRLTISDTAPVSGCRGIVAAAAISLEDLDATGPLISVPQQLQFTSSTALDIIQHSSTATSLAAAAQQQLSDTQLIAAALAHELHNTYRSSWQPYLASLPQQPPNPWLLTDPDQVLAAVEPYQQRLADAATTSVQDWVAAVTAARQEQLAAAAAVEALLGAALGISQHDVLTALGHVTSRSLVSGSSSGMCPVIDLVNHHASASAPMLQLDDSDTLVMTVLPLREGEAVPMSPGEELLILYKGGYTPLEAFLKFGFVADEWWRL